MLVVVAILISHKEKLALEKDILWSVGRAIIQLIGIVGYVLKYIFSVDDASLTLLMVLFICFNAAWNAQKRSKYIAKAFISSFIAITVGAGITLAVLILSGSIEFIPMQVIPIAGMIAGNAMVAVGLCYNNLGQRVISEQQQIQEKLSLGATPKQASAILIRDSIRAALIPTVDSAKTVGLVSLPGMMSGLIFAGIDPVKAIKYQIMVTFMLLSTASLSTIVACYLTYQRKFLQFAPPIGGDAIEEEMMRCRTRSIASGVVVHVPINKTSIQQRIRLAAILRRQCITRTQRSEDLLECFTCLTICGGEIFTQMPKQ